MGNKLLSDIMDITGEEIMPTACHAGLIRDMDLAVRLGASVDQVCDETGMPMVHLAVLSGNAQAVRWLISKGANPNQMNDEGMTAIQVAVKNKKLSSFDVLVHEGFGIKETFDFGDTLPHITARLNRSHLFHTIYEYGIALDQKNNDGLTPIEIAAYNDNARSLLEILDIGESVSKIELSKCSENVKSIIQAAKATHALKFII